MSTSEKEMVKEKIKEKNAKELESLEKGDRIRFKRKGYSHWGLYYGDGKVIHLYGVNDTGIDSGPKHIFTILGRKYPKAIVKIDDFLKVCQGRRAVKDNSVDEFYKPYPPDEIIEVASMYEGYIIGYNLFGYNCEHFATWCRNGISHSKQVQGSVSLRFRPSRRMKKGPTYTENVLGVKSDGDSDTEPVEAVDDFEVEWQKQELVEDTKGYAEEEWDEGLTDEDYDDD